MIDVKNLSKDYMIKRKGAGLSDALKGLVTRNTDVVHAVKDLSFHIDEGEIVGFIGPNGAGKSTTIKMMSGILTPTSGSVLIGGEDITKYRKEVVRNIGVVFGQRTQLNWDLRLGETFELLKHIYRIKQSEYDKTLDVMDDILGIKNSLISPSVRCLSDNASKEILLHPCFIPPKFFSLMSRRSDLMFPPNIHSASSSKR